MYAHVFHTWSACTCRCVDVAVDYHPAPCCVRLLHAGAGALGAMAPHLQAAKPTLQLTTMCNFVYFAQVLVQLSDSALERHLYKVRTCSREATYTL